MTFLAERLQPGFKAPAYSRERDGQRSDRAALLEALPIELEVWPEPRNETYEGVCACETVYRLTHASVLMLYRQQMLRKGLSDKRVPVLCGCMGRVVEG